MRLLYPAEQRSRLSGCWGLHNLSRVVGDRFAQLYKDYKEILLPIIRTLTTSDVSIHVRGKEPPRCPPAAPCCMTLTGPFGVSRSVCAWPL